jgi:uncharacterized membrane protein YdfJ with MMPL/SSD domain
VPAAAAFVMHSAHDGGHYDFIYLFIIIHYLLFVYYSFICYLVPAAATCVKHSAAA